MSGGVKRRSGYIRTVDVRNLIWRVIFEVCLKYGTILKPYSTSFHWRTSEILPCHYGYECEECNQNSPKLWECNKIWGSRVRSIFIAKSNNTSKKISANSFLILVKSNKLLFTSREDRNSTKVSKRSMISRL